MMLYYDYVSYIIKKNIIICYIN